MSDPTASALILTALPLEYAAARTHLSNVQPTRNDRGILYETGKFASSDCVWNIGLAQLYEPGNAAAALGAFEAIQHFKPQVVMFVGIAGGLKDVSLGDVAVGTKIYGYASGAAGRTFLPRPDVGESSERLVQLALYASRRSEWLQRAVTSGLGTMPRVFVAPIAAGPAVLKSKTSALYRFLKKECGDALAVEMEGRGFLKAARASENVRAIVVRGISDLINGKATADRDGWQQIAAAHAAAFALEVLVQQSASIRDTLQEPAPATELPSTEQLLAELVANDPLKGNHAVDALSRMGSAALPHLRGLLESCATNKYFTLQAAIRVPKVFSAIGDASTETLIDIIATGEWASKDEASSCFYGSQSVRAANALADLLKSWPNADVARCAIQGLGWLGYSGWWHRIMQETFDSGDYEFQKLKIYAVRASVLMLALQTNTTLVLQEALRVEDVLARCLERRVDESDLLRQCISLARYFRPTATEVIQQWIESKSTLLSRVAIEIVRIRRPPASIRLLADLAQDRTTSLELLWSACLTLGEIGTSEACRAVIALLESEQEDDLRRKHERMAQIAALSKMCHHLDGREYKKYAHMFTSSPALAMSAQYTICHARDTSEVERCLNGSDESARGPAAICLGIIGGAAATSTLKRHLRHAPSQLDSLFILAGLLRSGASEYYSQFCDNLGEAVTSSTVTSLEYLWKRELISLLANEPGTGNESARAWAEILCVDASECIEEADQILQAKTNVSTATPGDEKFSGTRSRT